MKSLNVKDDTHRILKLQAFKEGKSMLDLIDEMTKKRVKEWKAKKGKK